MFKMDSHIHSEYSPDSKSKIEDIIKIAESREIDIIATLIIRHADTKYGM